MLVGAVGFAIPVIFFPFTGALCCDTSVARSGGKQVLDATQERAATLVFPGAAGGGAAAAGSGGILFKASTFTANTSALGELRVI